MSDQSGLDSTPTPFSVNPSAFLSSPQTSDATGFTPEESGFCATAIRVSGATYPAQKPLNHRGKPGGDRSIACLRSRYGFTMACIFACLVAPTIADESVVTDAEANEIKWELVEGPEARQLAESTVARSLMERAKLFSGRVAIEGEQKTDDSRPLRNYPPTTVQGEVLFDFSQDAFLTQLSAPFHDHSTDNWDTARYAYLICPELSARYSSKWGMVTLSDAGTDVGHRGVFDRIVNPAVIGMASTKAVFVPKLPSESGREETFLGSNGVEVFQTDRYVRLKVTSSKGEFVSQFDTMCGGALVAYSLRLRFALNGVEALQPPEDEQQIEWQALGEYWVPVKWHAIDREYYRGANAAGAQEGVTVATERTWKLTWSDVNQVIPAKDFKYTAIKAPEGTWLNDRRTGPHVGPVFRSDDKNAGGVAEYEKGLMSIASANGKGFRMPPSTVFEKKPAGEKNVPLPMAGPQVQTSVPGQRLWLIVGGSVVLVALVTLLCVLRPGKLSPVSK